jgi:YjbE family integral membrane protein
MSASIDLGHVAGLLGAVLEIALIDLLLSGDNALVIALACRDLPHSVWRRVVWLGTVTGVALRIALTALAALVLDIPFLKLVGAVLLVAIGVKLSAPHASLATQHSAQQRGLWSALATILIADTVMSADNVLAVAAAAHGSTVLLSLGLLLSVPILIVASRMVSSALDRYPLLIPLGGALIGWVAGEMAAADPAAKTWLNAQPLVSAAAPPIGAACVLVLGRWLGPGPERPTP